MNHSALLQSNSLTATQKAIRDHFQHGGSLAVALAVIAGILVLIVLVRLLSNAIGGERRPRSAQSYMLFRSLMGKLRLPPSQFHLLDAVAQDLRLRNPTVLLISPELFDRYVGQWQPTCRERHAATARHIESSLIPRTRASLFPGDHPPIA